MFKFTQRPAQDQGCDETEHLQVGYGDDGLQQQLFTNLQQNDTNLPNYRSTVQLAGAQDARRPPVAHPAFIDRRSDSPPSPSPPAEDLGGLLGDLRTLTQGVLQQRGSSEPLHAEDGNIQQVQQAGQQVHADGNGPNSNTAAVLHDNRRMLENLLQEQHQPQRQQRQQQAGTPLNGAVHNGQHPPQQQQQQQQAEQPHRTPASLSQLLSSHTHQAAPLKQQQHKPQHQLQQRRKSVLYSTPQNQAPKKKARFSIKSTPPATAYGTPLGTAKPAAGGAAAAPAGPGASSSAALAALLGSGPAPSSRHGAGGAGADGAVVADSSGAHGTSKTPRTSSKSMGMAALFATPRFSTTKRSRLNPAAQHQASPATTGTPAAAAAAGSGLGSSRAAATRVPAAAGDAHAAEEELLAGPVVPAALFADDEGAAGDAAAADEGDHADAAQPAAGELDGQEQQQDNAGEAAQDLAAGGATSDAAVTPAAKHTSSSSRRRRSSSSATNPLLLLSEQRARQAQFLQALPAAAVRSPGSSLAGCLSQMGGRGVAVPVNSSLSKVMQQVQAAQKEQQEQLVAGHAAAAAAGGAGIQGSRGQSQGLLDLEVLSKGWEAHMLKCLCRVQQQQQLVQQQEQQPGQQQQIQGQQQQQQQQHRPGENVFLFVQSKTAHAVDLSPGHRVRVHAPWYEVVQQQPPDQPPVVLAYLITAAP